MRSNSLEWRCIGESLSERVNSLPGSSSFTSSRRRQAWLCELVRIWSSRNLRLASIHLVGRGRTHHPPRYLACCNLRTLEVWGLACVYMIWIEKQRSRFQNIVHLAKFCLVQSFELSLPPAPWQASGAARNPEGHFGGTIETSMKIQRTVSAREQVLAQLVVKQWQR